MGVRNMVIIIIIALLLPVSASAQTFNLLRVIFIFQDGGAVDTASDGFTQSGTMEIVGDSVSQTTNVCVLDPDFCAETKNLMGTIISSTNHNVMITGELVSSIPGGLVYFISTPPTLTLVFDFDNGNVTIQNWIQEE